MRGFAEGDVAFVLTRDGLEVRRRGNSGVLDHDTSALLTVNDLTVVGSTNSAIFANVEVTITNSTFSGNSNNGDGGAIQAGKATVTNSTFTNNTATGGNGGAIRLTDQSGQGGLTVTGSTFTGNSATGDGGAVFHGFATVDSTVAITNSTFTGNTATGAGGAVRADGGNGQIPVSLIYATIVGNTAARGANIATTSTLTSYGTVVAGPQGGGDNCAVPATTTQGYNYSDDASCGFTGTGDTENGADPQLRALGDFGGPTQTRPPEVTSQLVDAIPTADCDATVTIDQRKLPRPADGNNDGTNGCDIGAVELQPPLQPPTQRGPVAARPTFTG